MGSLASVVMGASMPVYAFLFGEVLPYKLKKSMNPPSESLGDNC